MSGVFGYCGPGARDARSVADHMGSALRRLPHQRMAVTPAAPGVALGIHGPKSLAQTVESVASPDGRFRLWLVGDLIDVGLEAPSDGQVAVPGASDEARLVLEHYRTAGISGLTSLSGGFLVALWDAEERELILVNDRFGLYPHYFTIVSGGFVFAPELKPLQFAPGFRAQLDLVAVAEFIRFQHLLGDRTWLEGVSVLPYGSIVRFRPDEARLTVTRYWDWDRVPRLEMSFNEGVDAAAGCFRSAVTARIRPRERAGVFLSGGLDSRLTAGVIAARQPVDTFTFGHPGCRDVQYARRVARSLGTRHHEHRLVGGAWVLEQMARHLALTEGFHGWHHMHGISMLEEAGEWIDVNLTGWDGGTILRAYAVNPQRDLALRRCRDGQELERLLFESMSQQLTWPGLSDHEAEALTARTLPQLPDLASGSVHDQFRRAIGFDSDRRADYFVAQQHVRRMSVNIVVMARSQLAVRCPYFDYALVDLCYGLPDAVRTDPSLVRAVLQRLAPALTWIPYEADLRLPHPSAGVRWVHALPRRAAHRLGRAGIRLWSERPRLYADYEQYLREDLRSWAEGLLFDRRTADRGFFDQAEVRALWERHLSGRELWTIGKISPLITVEQVCRYLVDGDPAEAAALGPTPGIR